MRLPPEVRDKVIRRMYSDADEAGWANLPAVDRSRMYDRWAEDPELRGLLSGYLEPERVRTWLKDNPMKHYAAAKHGIGTYAVYATVTGPTPARVLARSLGDGWDIDPKSVSDKPLQFRASRDEDNALVVYGPSRKFRDLLWAALNRAVEPCGPDRVVVLVVEDVVAPTPVFERRRQRLLADRCGVELKWSSFGAGDDASAS